MMKFVFSVMLLAAIAYLLICLCLFFWQNRIIFLPSGEIERRPDALELSYEDIWLSVLSGQGKLEKVHGWWIPASEPTNKVLLYLHGNGGNISCNVGAAARFQQTGFSVLLIDYRGYGRSQGHFPTELEIYRDALAAWDYLIEQRQVKAEDIFIYGHSLGAAVGLELAIAKPTAAGVIMENAFTSIKAIAENRALYRIFPLNLILTQRFDNLSKLEHLQIPLFVVYGLLDRTVPPKMGEMLYQKAKVPKKRLIVPDAGHNDVGAVAGQAYEEALETFIDLARRNQQQKIETL